MNRVELEGVTYVARKSPAGTCAGCAGFAPPGTKTTPLCRALPFCTKEDRDDGSSIVWVKESTTCNN